MKCCQCQLYLQYSTYQRTPWGQIQFEFEMISIKIQFHPNVWKNINYPFEIWICNRMKRANRKYLAKYYSKNTLDPLCRILLWSAINNDLKGWLRYNFNAFIANFRKIEIKTTLKGKTFINLRTLKCNVNWFAEPLIRIHKGSLLDV